MVVVITGGSRGIGAALAQRYRDRGARVIVTSRAGGVDPDDLALDVTQPDAFNALKTHLGDTRVDLLVCNAGVYSDKGQSLNAGYDPAMWAEGFATNVTGVFLTIQALLPNIRAASGKIAIISSQMGSTTRAPGGSYIYRASKAAALNLGRNLATDLAPDGIAVGVYHPGWVRTDMGGPSAEITVDQSADGLIDRFDALGLEATGCFETWDGRAHPY
ncbi:MAG: SDR family NAD(P)-dependent oxidoreductase [Rhodobacteraceae bacterium]|nr:SDR family NAD(P)-dependent oxidoreductase [Paracoccaceae bacterium]